LVALRLQEESQKASTAQVGGGESETAELCMHVRSTKLGIGFVSIDQVFRFGAQSRKAVVVRGAAPPHTRGTPQPFCLLEARRRSEQEGRRRERRQHRRLAVVPAGREDGCT